MRTAQLFIRVAFVAMFLHPQASLAQEIRFQGIAWGEARERVITLFRGLGLANPATLDNGDLLFFPSDSSARVTAMFGDNKLVAVNTVFAGDTSEVFPEYREFVRHITLERGPGEVRTGEIFQSYDWVHQQTRLSVSYDNGTTDTVGTVAASDHAIVFVSYAGPGYSEELERRTAPFIAQAEARRREWLLSRIGASRWQIVYFDDSLAVSFDPTRVQRTGNVLQVWQRWDSRSPELGTAGSYSTDATVLLMELNCATLRWRIQESIMYLGSRVQDSNSIPDDEWRLLVPETVGEEAGRAICAAAGRR